jgi:DNA-binding transcriptional LysR family regulator
MKQTMRGPSFAEASALVAVLEHKSFTKAARQLGLSPPSVSELVRKLEERLGVRLVERTTRAVAPTAAGEGLLERLRSVLGDYQAALEATNEFRDKPAGTVRLTVPPPAADFILAPAMARFLAAYPEINLDISVDSSPRDIVAERFDAGIRMGELLARDMIAVRVGDDVQMVVVGSPTYIARRGKPSTPRDLADHDCIRIRFSGGEFLPWRFRDNRRILEVQVPGRLIANDNAMLLQAAIEGVGLLRTAQPYAAAAVAAGQLVRVLDEWASPPGDGYYLYYPSRRQTRPALKALIDFLKAERRGSAGKRGEPSPKAASAATATAK